MCFSAYKALLLMPKLNFVYRFRFLVTNATVTKTQIKFCLHETAPLIPGRLSQKQRASQ